MENITPISLDEMSSEEIREQFTEKIYLDQVYSSVSKLLSIPIETLSLLADTPFCNMEKTGIFYKVVDTRTSSERFPYIISVGVDVADDLSFATAPAPFVSSQDETSAREVLMKGIGSF